MSRNSRRLTVDPQTDSAFDRVDATQQRVAESAVISDYLRSTGFGSGSGSDCDAELEYETN